MNRTSFFRTATALALLSGMAVSSVAMAAPARKDLRGKILLQVESKGEAWWVEPTSGERISLGRPADAFAVMRAKGVGISNANIWLIPIGYRAMSGADTDGDGLTDAFEDAIGTDKNAVDSDGDGHSDKDEIVNQFNPYSATDTKKTGSAGFTAPHLGKIFLQVESKGEAWWVNPADGKRYFLGRPTDAFDLMRGFGLGISNKDLGTITVSNFVLPAAPAPAPAPTPEPAPTPDETPAPVTDASSPVGSGYTLIRSHKNVDANAEFVIWDHYGQKGDAMESIYVDDVAKKYRIENVYPDGSSYAEFGSVANGQFSQLKCRYSGVNGELPRCKRFSTDAGAASRYFPSTGTDVSGVTGNSTLQAEDRTLLGHKVPCFNTGLEQSCFYGGNMAVELYHSDGTGTGTPISFKIGRPEASLLSEPTDFDGWVEGVTAGPDPIGVGYTTTLAVTVADKDVENLIFAPYKERGDFTQKVFVDDKEKKWRVDYEFPTVKYSEFVQVINGTTLDSLTCRQEEGTVNLTCKQQTITDVSQSELRKFPSYARSASASAGTPALETNRVLAGFATSCIGAQNLHACYFNDLDALTALLDNGSVRFVATEHAVEQPDASVFFRPTDYVAWPQ